MMSVGASAAAGDVTINSTNFPDANFRSVVAQADANGNGVLSAAERQEVEGFFLGGSNIKNLKGIEFFTGLQYLDCTDNQLTKLDVSKNTKLEYLDCSYNQLAALDVTLNTALVGLDCSGNKLTALNVTKNKLLEELYCSENQLTKLDVYSNTKLVYLTCDENKLSALNVSLNPDLVGLDCSYNNLTSLNMAKNTSLGTLYCSDNQLTMLNVQPCWSLRYLYCENNRLTKLDVVNNGWLIELCADNNQLTALDLRYNNELTEVSVENNEFTILTVPKNGTISLARLVSNGFDPTKAVGFECGGQPVTFDPETNTLSGLTNGKDGYYTVTYSYKTGNGHAFFQPFTLKIADGTVDINPFTDVSQSQYFYKPVLWAVSNDITAGVTPTTFAPMQTCTRGQVVSFLWRAAGEPAPQSTANPFTDVKDSAFYYKAVLWAVENGITAGMSPTEFAPGLACTRGQIVCFIYRNYNK